MKRIILSIPLWSLFLQACGVNSSWEMLPEKGFNKKIGLSSSLRLRGGAGETGGVKNCTGQHTKNLSSGVAVIASNPDTHAISLESVPTELSLEERASLLKRNILFLPMQALLCEFKGQGVFKDPTTVVALNLLKKSKFAQDKSEEYNIEYLTDILKDSARKNIRSKRGNDDPRKFIPESLIKDIETLQAQMQDLCLKMEKIRPLLDDEMSARVTSLRFHLGDMIEAERQYQILEKQKIRTERRKHFLPRKAVRMMQEWLQKNRENPYPDEATKRNFVKEGGIKRKQVDYWFINARARMLKLKNQKNSS